MYSNQTNSKEKNYILASSPCLTVWSDLFKTMLTLKISNGDTHEFSKNEISHELWNDGEGHTEDGQEQVADAQVQQEHVGHSPHPLVLDQSQNHQPVTYYTQYKDDRIQSNPYVPILVKFRMPTHCSVVPREYTIIEYVFQCRKRHILGRHGTGSQTK